MDNYWLKRDLEKRKKHGYTYKRLNLNRVGPKDHKHLYGTRKFRVGDKVICNMAEDSPRGRALKLGKIYTVTYLSVYHGIPSVYVDEILWRYMEDRFDFAE